MSEKKNFATIRFCIPALRTKIVLAEPWEFDLFHESRNDSLLVKLKPDGLKVVPCSWRPNKLVVQDRYKPRDEWGDSGNNYKYSRVTAPAGTKLAVDRIYIRNGCGNFDSVTFRVSKKDSPDERFCSTRFWAKLRDVNRISCIPIGDESSLAQFESFLGGGKSFLAEADRYDFLLG